MQIIQYILPIFFIYYLLHIISYCTKKDTHYSTVPLYSSDIFKSIVQRKFFELLALLLISFYIYWYIFKYTPLHSNKLVIDIKQFIENQSVLLIEFYILHILRSLIKAHQQVVTNIYIRNLGNSENSLLKLNEFLNGHQSSLKVSEKRFKLLSLCSPATLIPLLIGYIYSNFNEEKDLNYYSIFLLLLFIFYMISIIASYQQYKELTSIITELKNKIQTINYDTKTT